MQRVIRVAVYTCKHSGFASRNNESEGPPVSEIRQPSHTEAFHVIDRFLTTPSRSKLVLELESGEKILLVPTLQKDSKALDQDGIVTGTAKWDLSSEILPPGSSL